MQINQPTGAKQASNHLAVTAGNAPIEPNSAKHEPFGSYAKMMKVLGRNQDKALRKADSATADVNYKLKEGLDQLPVETNLKKCRKQIDTLANSMANTLEERRSHQQQAEQLNPLLKPLEEQYAQLQIERNKLTVLHESILGLMNDSNEFYRFLSDPKRYTPSSERNKIEGTKMTALHQSIARKVDEFKNTYDNYRNKLLELNQRTLLTSEKIATRVRETAAPISAASQYGGAAP